MATMRNDFGEDRVVPTLGYALVAAGETVTVPDDQVEHWTAGGWTHVEPAAAALTKTAPPAAVAPATAGAESPED